MMASLVGNLGQPLLFLLAFGVGLGQKIDTIEGFTYLQFIAPGLTASAVMYSAAFETTYGSFTRLSTQNTFEGILMTPVTVEEVAIGEIVWGALKGLLSGGVMIVTMPLFGLWPSPWVVLLLPLLFITGVLFASLGLIMTATARNYEFFNYFISLVITPLFLFSGIFFSLSTLSAGSRFFLQVLPLTPMVTLSRMFCYGDFSGNVWGRILLITIFAGGATLFGTVLLRRRLIK